MKIIGCVWFGGGIETRLDIPLRSVRLIRLGILAQVVHKPRSIASKEGVNEYVGSALVLCSFVSLAQLSGPTVLSLRIETPRGSIALKKG